MRHFTLLVAAIFLCICVPVVIAQTAPAQLCVANMQFHGAPDSNSFGRDALLKFLAKEKDKAIVQSVAIDASDPEQALQSAKTKNCDYLVTTDQTEGHQQNSVMTGTFGNTSLPTYYVTTVYKLTKVSDGSEVMGGNFKAADQSSEQNAVGFAMHKVADKVTEAIKKAGPVSK